MTTHISRRRLPVLFAAIAALAVAGAVLASLFSTAEAQTETTNFYLWRTTMTVGEDSGYLGYDSDLNAPLGSISTDADFGYPPWNPPHKHHFDPDYEFTVEALYLDPTGDGSLVLKVDGAGIERGPDVGKITLWIGNTSFPLEFQPTSVIPVKFHSVLIFQTDPTSTGKKTTRSGWCCLTSAACRRRRRM